MIQKPFQILALTLACFIGLFFQPNTAQASDTLYAAIREGRAIAMMRHAIAPGGGDPSNFRIDDCSTQRNLSQEGRDQAKRIGEAFRANGIRQAQVVTSQWCRCLDTATQLALGDYTELPALNSFFENRSQGAPQTKALREYLMARTSTQPLILVTHQVNITALTGEFASSGEVIVFSMDDKGEVTVLGSL
jgi:phosphohistidine phosphatase SixA